MLVSARRLRELKLTSADELPPAEPIDKVPRVLKQIGLMGLPQGAEVEADPGSPLSDPGSRIPDPDLRPLLK